MTDAEAAAIQARIAHTVREWRDAMGLNRWHLTNEYYRDRQEHLAPAAAQVTAHWEYLQAYIEWDQHEMAALDADRFENAVIHELCHLLVNELQPKKRPPGYQVHEERVVSELALAFRWTYEAGAERDVLALNG